jgi:hypothetical protein
MSTPTRCIPQHMMMGTHVQFGQAHTYYDSRDIEEMLQPGFWNNLCRGQPNDQLRVGDSLRIIQVWIPESAQAMNTAQQISRFRVAAYVDTTVVIATEHGATLSLDSPIRKISAPPPEKTEEEKKAPPPMPGPIVHQADVVNVVPKRPAPPMESPLPNPPVDGGEVMVDVVEEATDADPANPNIVLGPPHSIAHKSHGEYQVLDENENVICEIERADGGKKAAQAILDGTIPVPAKVPVAA